MAIMGAKGFGTAGAKFICTRIHIRKYEYTKIAQSYFSVEIFGYFVLHFGIISIE